MVIAEQDIAPEYLDILMTVHDPEIPVLTIVDMGIMRKVEKVDDKVILHITPTYSGCPAMDTIADDIITAFREHGLEAEVELVLSPAWSTDQITERGRERMREYGIAPPLQETADKHALLGQAAIVPCTNCGSKNTKMISQFGSTACKALFQCSDCLEPFDYFKCLK